MKTGILHRTLAPAPNLTPSLQYQAEGYLCDVLEALDYVGVLAIEFFQVGDRLIANEMAPRVHNSGHWTIEGAVTSQFENHLRAIVGFPLGSTANLGVSVMLNIIGDAIGTEPALSVPRCAFAPLWQSAASRTQAGTHYLPYTPVGMCFYVLLGMYYQKELNAFSTMGVCADSAVAYDGARRKNRIRHKNHSTGRGYAATGQSRISGGVGRHRRKY